VLCPSPILNPSQPFVKNVKINRMATTEAVEVKLFGKWSFEDVEVRRGLLLQAFLRGQQPTAASSSRKLRTL
jgi:hypothetical protein